MDSAVIKSKFTIGYALRLFFMIILSFWFFADAVRTFNYAITQWGFGIGIRDGVSIFRLAEFLIIVPILGYFLVAANIGKYLSWARWVIWAGVLLAGLSYPGLQGRIDWTFMVWVIAIFGLLMPFLLAEKLNCSTSLLAWFGMTTILTFKLVDVIAAFILHGYVLFPYPAPFPHPGNSFGDRAQQDIRYLGTEMVRLHDNAYHTTSEEKFWEEIDQIESLAPGLSDGEFALELMRMVALVGDGHTAFVSPGKLSFQKLPMDVDWYADGLYIRRIYENYPQAVGAKILKFGDLSVEEVYQSALPYITHENDAWARVKSPNVLVSVDYLTKIGAAVPGEPVLLTLSDQEQGIFEVNVEPLTSGKYVKYLSVEQELPYYQSKPNKAFWFEYHPNSRTMYFRYAACVFPLRFRSTVNQMWKVVDEQPVERFVIDLRGNGGGNAFQFLEFFMPGLKEREEINQAGRLFVLVDQGSFSGGSEAAFTLKLETPAIFVGSPTGGMPNEYGEVRNFTLPNSRARISYSTNYFEVYPGLTTNLIPDQMIAPTGLQAFQGVDPVLEWVVPGESW